MGSIVPVRRGFWGTKLGKPHTVPCKVTGKCGSIWVRLIPAPRGTGIVSATVPKKLLQMAGIEDCYTSAKGSTGTLGNFAKATYAAIAETYSYLTPDLWMEADGEEMFSDPMLAQSSSAHNCESGINPGHS